MTFSQKQWRPDSIKTVGRALTHGISMAIDRPEATDAAPIRAGASAEDGGGATFLPREEWAIRGPRAAWPAWGGLPGEESRDAPLRHRRSRRSRPPARSRNRRGRSGAVDGQERRE